MRTETWLPYACVPYPEASQRSALLLTHIARLFALSSVFRWITAIWSTLSFVSLLRLFRQFLQQLCNNRVHGLCFSLPPLQRFTVLWPPLPLRSFFVIAAVSWPVARDTWLAQWCKVERLVAAAARGGGPVERYVWGFGLADIGGGDCTAGAMNLAFQFNSPFQLKTYIHGLCFVSSFRETKSPRC